MIPRSFSGIPTPPTTLSFTGAIFLYHIYLLLYTPGFPVYICIHCSPYTSPTCIQDISIDMYTLTPPFRQGPGAPRLHSSTPGIVCMYVLHVMCKGGMTDIDTKIDICPTLGCQSLTPPFFSSVAPQLYAHALKKIFFLHKLPFLRVWLAPLPLRQ